MCASRKFISAAYLLLAAGLCQAPIASAGVYEDLRWAVDDNNITDVTKLLAKGADPNTPDEQGNTLLMVARRHNTTALAELLIHPRSKHNLRNRSCETANEHSSNHGPSRTTQ